MYNEQLYHPSNVVVRSDVDDHMDTQFAAPIVVSAVTMSRMDDHLDSQFEAQHANDCMHAMTDTGGYQSPQFKTRYAVGEDAVPAMQTTPTAFSMREWSSSDDTVESINENPYL